MKLGNNPPVIVGARWARPGFAASGKPRIARGASSPHATSVPRGDPEFLAAGLPLTWVSGQKDSFKAYLLQKDSVDFSFRGVDYHVEFAGAEIYPQGFSAVTDKLRDFRGVNMLCDIGNGTISSAQASQVSLCRKRQSSSAPLRLLSPRDRRAAWGPREHFVRHSEFMQCAVGIMRRLRDHEYDAELMKLYVMGGGSCLIKNFAEYDEARVTVNDDICATAKGYERLAENALRKNGGSI